MDKNTFKRLILVLFLVTGVFFLYMGYREYFSDIQKTKNYETTDGYFMKYDMQKSNDTVVYTLTYSYVVDRQTYFVNAQNKVTKLPALGSQKKIKYMKKDPQKAVVVELQGGIKYILTGLIFLIISVFGLTIRLLNHYQEDDRKFYKITGIVSGLVILLIGVFIYSLYARAINSTAIMDIWSAIQYMSLIPFAFILVGMLIVIAIVFFKKEDIVE